ncbi:MAG: ISAs1 family transposase [Acidobacteriaceae bacterium]
MSWGDGESPKVFCRDPRVERTREHLLAEILLITIAAVLSGANGWNEIEDYAQSKVEWFKSFQRLPGGIPSHDTFNRVFLALDPEELEKGFVAWVSPIAKLTAAEVVGRRGDQGAARHARVGGKGHRAYGFGVGKQQQPSAGSAPSG